MWLSNYNNIAIFNDWLSHCLSSCKSFFSVFLLRSSSLLAWLIHSCHGKIPHPRDATAHHRLAGIDQAGGSTTNCAVTGTGGHSGDTGSIVWGSAIALGEKSDIQQELQLLLLLLMYLNFF